MRPWPKIKRPVVSFALAATSLVVGGEVVAFRYGHDTAWTVQANALGTAGRGIGSFSSEAARIVTCRVLSAAPYYDYNPNCLGWGPDGSNHDSASSPDSPPDAPTDTVQASDAKVDVDLEAVMITAGYSCEPGSERTQTIGSGDTPINVLGDTDAANAAAANGVFDGLRFPLGDTVRTASCG